jgi:hypothetical protein
MTFIFPFPRRRLGKDLRDTAPPDILHENTSLLVRCSTLFRVEFADEFDGREIGAAFLLERTFANSIGWLDSVIARV